MMCASRPSRHSSHISRSNRGSGSSGTRRHNPPLRALAPSPSFALVQAPDTVPREYWPWDEEIEDVLLFFAYGLRRDNFQLGGDKLLGKMARKGWDALTDLMNELITVNNYGYKPLLGGELRMIINDTSRVRVYSKLLKDADAPKITRKWIRKEFLDIVLSYPTPIAKSLAIANHNSALQKPEIRWLWGGINVDGIEKAAQAIRKHNDDKTGARSIPPFPESEFFRKPGLALENQSEWSLESYDAVRAQEPYHHSSIQQQVGQPFSGYQGSPSVSQASGIQPYGTQQAGGFIGDYSQGYESEQQSTHPAAYPGQHAQYQENQGTFLDIQASTIQPYGTQQAGGFIGDYSQGYESEQQAAYPTAYPGQHTQYQENQGTFSGSQSWAMQPLTGQTLATQSYVAQPSDAYTGVHSRGYQSGQGGQDDQYYYNQ
ncbi:hypothetical protein ACHAP3_010504 [Botrytis cinerea]